MRPFALSPEARSKATRDLRDGGPLMYSSYAVGSSAPAQCLMR